MCNFWVGLMWNVKRQLHETATVCAWTIRACVWSSLKYFLLCSVTNICMWCRLVQSEKWKLSCWNNWNLVSLLKYSYCLPRWHLRFPSFLADFLNNFRFELVILLQSNVWHLNGMHLHQEFPRKPKLMNCNINLWAFFM